MSHDVAGRQKICSMVKNSMEWRHTPVSSRIQLLEIFCVG
jgi:hypothetical protein